MKDRIQSQITELTKLNSVTKAKAWWNSLSRNEKAVAIGLLVGMGFATAYFATSIGTVSVSGKAITATHALWGAVCIGSLTGAMSASIAKTLITELDEDEAIS